MRLLACLLICLLPTVTSAQAIASASSPPVPAQETRLEEEFDVLPAAMDERTMGLLFLVGVTVFTLVLFGISDGQPVGETLLGAVATVAVCGGVAYCLYGNGGAPDLVQASSGAMYEAEAIASFGADALTVEQRRSLAESAREHGRAGVVLQRVVETRAGIGEAQGTYVLEVSVVDAETAQLRPVADDLLGASSVLSIPIADRDLGAAQAEILDRLLSNS